MLSTIFLLFIAALLWKYVQAIRHPHIKSLNYAPGGGGYPPPPPPPDYQAQSAARMSEMREQARLDEEAAQRERERKAVEDQAKRDTFSSKLQSAYVGAQNYGNSRLQSLGFEDKYGIMPAYMSELDRARSAIPDLDPNPGSYFTPTLFENALSSQRNVQRGNLNRQFDQFASPGFELSYFADNADDDIINNIINEQYGNANDYLTRALGRGQLNQTGYDYALQQLSSSRPGAVSRANDMGLGVLQKDRDMLSNLATEGRNRITNFDFGDTFDPNSYRSRIQSTADQYRGRLEGDLRNTFGDTQFFDPTKLVTKGGAFQGQSNPGTGGTGGTGTNPLLNSITDDQLKRTSGSQGAF